ncbi:uncharacterized protein [Miscanthus floridulus]|uniref:uncharacterized protein n=1 Tax=Miscanthus floridulus TaxID=154761 RepID=UPI003458AD6C
MGKIKFYEHYVFGKHKRVKFNASVHTTKEWKVMIERQTEKKVKLLRTDNGGEFCSDAFNDYCREEGIVRHHTILLSTDVSPVGSDEEQEHVSVQVEHVDDQETEIVDNNVHDIVQHSHPVENIHEPATYTEAVVSGDREKWIFAICVYIKFVDGSPIYLLLYVDDMLIAAKSKKEITMLKKLLSSEFEMKDHGAALQCASTDENFECMSRVPYSSAVGSLMYLCGTTNACLKFGRTDKGLTGYMDSDFAADLDKRRSLIGYMFTIGGCAVSWRAIL